MTTLTNFLLARIAEDEAVSRACSGDGWSDAASMWAMDGGSSVITNPARVVLECEAKRRIVERHRPFSHGRCQACYSREAQDEWAANPWPCPDLRDLALPYADHPDYREEWKP